MPSSLQDAAAPFNRTAALARSISTWAPMDSRKPHSQLARQQQRPYSARSHSLQGWINGRLPPFFSLSSRFNNEFPPKVLLVTVSHLYELTIFR